MLQEVSASSYSTSTLLHDFFISQPYLHFHYILGILCKPSFLLFFFLFLHQRLWEFFVLPKESICPISLLQHMHFTCTPLSLCLTTLCSLRASLPGLSFSLLLRTLHALHFIYFFFFHLTPRITTASYAEKTRPLFPLLILNKISGFLSRNQS